MEMVCKIVVQANSPGLWPSGVLDLSLAGGTESATLQRAEGLVVQCVAAQVCALFV